MKIRIFISVLFLYCFGNLIYSQPVIQTRSIQKYYLSSGNYNGTDLKALYLNQLGPVGGLIFERVFFYGYNSAAVNYNYIMIKGTLK
jgi:hypothetical protein